jgi:hypothetical protein
MKPRNKRERNKKGVAFFFFLMVFGLLLGFLMLVVNTGMIVYQKIRLQTTADLASYAGAAVQASYLGNASSGEDSLRGINFKILQRYSKLTQELQDLNKTPAPWPGIVPMEIPGPAGWAACIAMCQAANLMNAQLRVAKYKAASQDMEKLRQKALRILTDLPKSSQRAAEATVAMNIPDLAIEGSSLAALISQNTNKVDEIVRASSGGVSGSAFVKKKNAVLSFSSAKGMYLANIVASVPHAFVYYGPSCSGYKFVEDTAIPTGWFCHVNGQGAGTSTGGSGGSGMMVSGPMGYAMAAAAFGRSFAPATISGNIGTIDKISKQKANAIRIHFVQNANRPEPWFMSALEWYPTNGSFMNMENSLGATGSLFPKQTRLVAVSAAEPFGGTLIGSNSPIFGVRLQSIRKILLDPRLSAVKADFPGIYDYMQSLAPIDNQGRATEKADEVIRRFLH